MINTGLVILLFIIMGIGYKIMDKVDKFMENGGFSEEND